MSQIGAVQVNVSGDVGGLGMSRFHFERVDVAAITAADCNAAAAAVRALIFAFEVVIPTDITWSFEPVVKCYDVVTGEILSLVTMTTVPADVSGVSTADYGAGLGARINWKTTALSNRRFLRSANFMVPLAGGAFTTNGAVSSATVAAGNTAIAAYLAAMTAANVVPLAWHRPPKGTFTGGIQGAISAGSVSSTPAGLRTRRS